MIFRNHQPQIMYQFGSRNEHIFLEKWVFAWNINSLVDRDIERSKLDGFLAIEFLFLENSCGCGCAKINNVRCIEAAVRRCSSK